MAVAISRLVGVPCFQITPIGHHARVGVVGPKRAVSTAIGTPALLFRLGLLPRGGLGEDPLGVVFEQVAAAGAADPVGLALIADLDRAAALGNDAQRVRLARGEGDPLAGVGDLAEPGE